MKKLFTKKINIIEQVKVYSKGGKPIFKTGTCRDKHFTVTC